MEHDLNSIMCASDELSTSSSDDDFVVKTKRSRRSQASESITDENSSCNVSVNESDNYGDVTANRRVMSDIILICCVCLENTNTDENEIMFCDNCGYAVHEVPSPEYFASKPDGHSRKCYGVVDVDDDSTDSSEDKYNPTSFWFCEACCAGVYEPSCELCPNVGGGIYKRTDDNRWVHMVCAIYNKYVTFHDTNILWPVDLSDVPSNTFGHKACVYCTNVLYSRTGICVPCEAGLCKAAFHVTCAQKNGLLMFISTEQSDPCLCYCKQHSDKEHVQQKLQDYEALQAFAESVRNRSLPLAEQMKKERYFQKSRERYKAKLNSFVKTEVIVKKTRPITSCPSALKKLLKKADIVGDRNSCEVVSHGRSITPAFNVEFVNYFLEREQKISELLQRLEKLEKQHDQLTIKEKNMVDNYDGMKHLSKERRRMRNNAKMSFECLQKVLGKQVPIPNKLKCVLENGNAKVEEQKNVSLKTCTVCHLEQRQDMIVKCDTCLKYYHLYCLDPPLKVLPKKSRLYGWQCSFCTFKRSQSDTESDIECSDLRVLRSTTRNSSFYLLPAQDSADNKIPNSDGGDSSDDSITMPLSVQSKTGVIGFDNQGVVLDLEKKDLEKNSLCKICGMNGKHDSMANCDICSGNYHFTCLNPPLTKNPKSRGYQWICHSCSVINEEKKAVKN